MSWQVTSTASSAMRLNTLQCLLHAHKYILEIGFVSSWIHKVHTLKQELRTLLLSQPVWCCKFKAKVMAEQSRRFPKASAFLSLLLDVVVGNLWMLSIVPLCQHCWFLALRAQPLVSPEVVRQSDWWYLQVPSNWMALFSTPERCSFYLHTSYLGNESQKVPYSL